MRSAPIDALGLSKTLCHPVMLVVQKRGQFKPADNPVDPYDGLDRVN